MKMRQTLFSLLLVLLISLAACGPAARGGEPAADPDTPVSSDDPAAAPREEPSDGASGEMIAGEAAVESIQIMILESFPVQVRVQVEGYLSDGCTALDETAVTREEDAFFVTMTTRRPVDAVCTEALVPFTESVPLDVAGLEAGEYTVDVNGVSDTFTLAVDNVLPDGAEAPGAELPGTGGFDTAALSQDDVAELIRLTLDRALAEQEIPDYALLADQETLVLSGEHLPDGLDLSGFELTVLSPEEIQARADAEGDFPYLRFQSITADNADSAQVSLGSAWAIAADSEMLYLSGGGFTIEYTRTGDDWQGEIVEQWIS